MNKRIFLALLLLVEVVALIYTFGKYSQLEHDILQVQGQYAERYAELHAQWLKVAFGIVMIMLILPFTAYFLVRDWKKK